MNSDAIEDELRQLEAELMAETDAARQQRLELMVESRRRQLEDMEREARAQP